MAADELKKFHGALALAICLSFGAVFAHRDLYFASAAAWFWENRPQIQTQAQAKETTTPILYDSFAPLGAPPAPYKVGPERKSTPVTNYGLIQDQDS